MPSTGRRSAEDRRTAIGARITELRTARSMSLSALARAAGIGKGSLSELESGQRNPTIDTLYAVAGPLGVPLSALLGEESGTEGSGRSLSARLLHVEHHPDGAVTEVFWLTVTPGDVRESPAHGPGVVENVHVVSGNLTAGRRGAENSAGPGETLQWISDVRHTYRSDAGAQAVLTIHTPPPR
ncbi:helix-turn-helix domain protein [Gordonia bronchialis DSM 43247]|uniref:Helix-turn-helix domain protein n=1 Tax=Gordonia bronchialis (strain ATCC 25592 / DSM 43247 / BCRC 13721 / JCM 3198 / KCTC 3076 / NBRC 16047 / NCTC 10667) TaxID=526226 RepID=D0L2V7_GORB4|nr:helix-turn-helix transcriptional regulator [Gordonia bronchialis]ACY20082.1 helix-turn-helix domain protein [Gordonia bronchialis DSM 43247]MCC3322854.1 helix-turn-helix domain-containing protein [Gordonia bronchialis]QGS26071.1 helix-turn-helix domain-containing protein [Gordonia bronchialis]UAK37536.1 helix-turn-helix domain-containing protein [Gordonia bronchialis]STQ62872.1 HTH-type transcriptional regulator sinR [Gordonia bronchialis]